MSNFIAFSLLTECIHHHIAPSKRIVVPENHIIEVSPNDAALVLFEFT